MLLEAEEARDRPSGDQARTTGDRPTDLLIAELQDRVRSLEEAARGNGCIIAALTARIPAIEAPADEQDDPETVERFLEPLSIYHGPKVNCSLQNALDTTL